jgi:rhodanese-related sulfurtransferase/rubrerythrin
MIMLKKLFTPVTSLDAEEARQYMAEHPEGSYVLLDVRQPGEYEEEHIPGAKLIPLPQLADAYPELDPEKPTLVHCAIGGRSRVAAQLLSGWGFSEIYNLTGGIKAFKGQKVAGPEELHLDLVRGDESSPEILTLAYAMEKGMQGFYQTVAAQTPDQELQGLAQKLAQVEVEHEKSFFALYQEFDPGKDLAAFEAEILPQVMEGGFTIQEFLAQNQDHLNTVKDLLELAMMLETQALDLYMRFAHRSTDSKTKETLFHIANQEKAHLTTLGRLLEEKLGQPFTHKDTKNTRNH